jgi:hypothetical protein
LPIFADASDVWTLGDFFADTNVFNND